MHAKPSLIQILCRSAQELQGQLRKRDADVRERLVGCIVKSNVANIAGSSGEKWLTGSREADATASRPRAGYRRARTGCKRAPIGHRPHEPDAWHGPNRIQPGMGTVFLDQQLPACYSH